MTRASLTPRLPRTPPQTIAFAVGDIHGRLDLLDGFLTELRGAGDAAAREGARVVAVFLGDYIDRGPQSAGVLERLSRLQAGPACDFIFLRGNHEQVLLDLFDAQENTTRWLNFGGKETLASYGAEPAAASTVEALHDLVKAVVPPHHIQFLRKTQLSAQVGDYFFVHAGLRPDRLVEEQSDSDLLWFRYYEDEPPVWDHMVVHGHSPNARPVVGRWRIAIDTEAHASGALTALRAEGERQTLLRISGDAAGKVGVDKWDEIDRNYRSADRERPEPRERARSPDRRERRARAEPEPGAGEAREARLRRDAVATPRPAPSKLRRRSRRMAWGAVGALVVVSCTGLVLSARDLASRPDAADQKASQVAPPQPDLALRDAAAIYSVPTTTAAAPVPPPQPETASPETRPTPPAPAASMPDGPVVQVAAVDTEDAARAYWADLQKKLPTGAADRTLRIEAADKGGRTFQRVVVAGFDSAKDAAAFCAALKAVDQACLVRTR